MKVTLEKVTLAKVEVDLPETCPKCRLPFVPKPEEEEEPFRLIEESMIGCSQPIRIDAEGNGVDYQDYDATIEIQTVTGYRCGNCDGQIVTTETNDNADPWAALEAIQRIVTDEATPETPALSMIGRILREAGL